ncbi:MAG TPA: toll/interleukin-1 receptor domain-containing protein [Thermoanaerobaculia bacterium]|nr:toll/interleukin-1 receptor domain-containing protein [Thermoanaerobaculia bacterium]
MESLQTFTPEASGSDIPAGGGGPPAEAAFKYDIFVSYSHLDQEWVQGCLLPRLQSEHLKICIDEDDFEVGDFSVLSMQEAVRRSRHTLIVLTPNWVDSVWAEFESLLTVTGAPLQRRLLPLLLSPCEPPPYIAALVYADFTQPSRREVEMARLLRSIGAAPPPEAVRGEAVRKGLAALSDLMREPRVRDAVISFRIHFQNACDKIEIAGNYKDLHDLLHTLQLHCYDRIVQEAKSFPGDELSQANLAEHEATLQGLLDDLRDVVRRGGVTPNEVCWIERDLEPARQDLRGALETKDARQLKRAAWKINRVLAIEPSQINTRLNDAASTLPLPALIAAMSVVLGQIRSLDLDADKVHQFEVGVDTLSRLHVTLTALVLDHDRWQEADLDLRLIESNLEQSLDALEFSWSQVKEKLAPLADGTSEPWAVTFRQEAERLALALEAQDAARSRLHFRSFRRLAGIRFHRVDVILKDQCDELRKVGEPLASVLRRMS